MNAKEFKEKRRLTVELPGGEKVIVRKLGQYDFLAMGSLPDIMAAAEGARAGKVNTEYEFKIEKLTITSAALDPKIVDKKPADCAEDEVSIYEFSAEEIGILCREIMKFSGLAGGAGIDPATFQETKKDVATT